MEFVWMFIVAAFPAVAAWALLFWGMNKAIQPCERQDAPSWDMPKEEPDNHFTEMIERSYLSRAA